MLAFAGAFLGPLLIAAWSSELAFTGRTKVELPYWLVRPRLQSGAHNLVQSPPCGWRMRQGSLLPARGLSGWLQPGVQAAGDQRLTHTADLWPVQMGLLNLLSFVMGAMGLPALLIFPLYMFRCCGDLRIPLALSWCCCMRTASCEGCCGQPTC